MELQIEIKLLKQQLAGRPFAVSLLLNGVVAVAVVKEFGSVASAGVVLIGVDAEGSAENLLLNLQANNTAAGLVWSRVGTSVFGNYTADGLITSEGVAGQPDYVSVYIQDPLTFGTAPFDTDIIEIEVIDTYENERILTEEITQEGSPTITWEGGDDIYDALMASKLTFNLGVRGYADGKFLHLLTGDESRYLVRLRSIDYAEVPVVLWQGFILPDLYSEPWRNGVPFVEFTAIDMLASLKAKFFKKWYYYQVYNLPELLGNILSQTGLLQELWVKPALVNVSHGEDWQWRDITVSLLNFMDGDNYENLYDILTSLLAAQGLRLYSWRGKWFLTGLTRLQELTGDCEVYHPDGIYKETVTVANAVVRPVYTDGTVNITAETPWQRVSLELNAQTENNLFPEDVVKREFGSTAYDFADDAHDFYTGWLTTYINNWVVVGVMPALIQPFRPYLGVFRDTAQPAEDYNVSEASAAVNYIKGLTTASVIAGRRYKLELNVLVTHILPTAHTQDWMEEHLINGHFNNLLVFRMFVNGSEIMSNRPSFPNNHLYQFQKKFNAVDPVFSQVLFTADYTLEWEFTVPVSGEVTFHWLPALGAILGYDILNYFYEPQTVKISNVSDVEKLESVRAVRPINYTREYKTDLDMTCTVDTSVKNSFGINQRLLNRFNDITPAGIQPLQQFHYFTQNEQQIAIELLLTMWPISAFLQDIIFRAQNQQSVYLVKEDGTEVTFPSLYTRTAFGVPHAAAYHGFDAPLGGTPEIPEDYPELPYIGENDALMLMTSGFAVEDRTKRALWKVYGFDDATANSYMKTLAYACHCVRPDTAFSMDAEALQLVWPLQTVAFEYLEQDRLFIPTRLTVSLFEGKTQLTMKEALLTSLTDVTYE